MKENQLILQAHLIPDGTKVKKVNGSRTFRLLHRLVVHGVETIKDGEEKRVSLGGFSEVTTDGNVVFLVSEAGVNAIPSDTGLVVADLTLVQMQEFLEEINSRDDE